MLMESLQSHELSYFHACYENTGDKIPVIVLRGDGAMLEEALQYFKLMASAENDARQLPRLDRKSVV